MALKRLNEPDTQICSLHFERNDLMVSDFEHLTLALLLFDDFSQQCCVSFDQLGQLGLFDFRLISEFNYFHQLKSCLIIVNFLKILLFSLTFNIFMFFLSYNTQPLILKERESRFLSNSKAKYLKRVIPYGIMLIRNLSNLFPEIFSR